MFRVGPWDCDLNVHLTNSRYAQIMDCGRLDWLIRSGTGSMVLTGALRPVAVEIHLRFLKELPFGTQAALRTRVTGQIRKAVVLDQAFYLPNGDLAARAEVRVVGLGPGGALAPDAWVRGIGPANDPKHDLRVLRSQ